MKRIKANQLKNGIGLFGKNDSDISETFSRI